MPDPVSDQSRAQEGGVRRGFFSRSLSLHRDFVDAVEPEELMRALRSPSARADPQD